MLTDAEWQIVELSLRVSLVAVLVTLPIAFALAWVSARTHIRGKILLDALVHLPLVIPPVVTGWLLLIMLGPGGAIGGWLDRVLGIQFVFRWTGAALASGVMALPLMVRAMRLSIEAVDRRLEQASRTLGAGRWRTFFRVTVPLCLPGIVAGSVLGFARSIGEFGATITFVSNVPGQTQTLPLAIYSALQVPGREGFATRLAILSIILSLLALLVSEWLVRRGSREGGIV